MHIFPLAKLKKKYAPWLITKENTNPNIQVKLIASHKDSVFTAAAAARTCYSSKGFLTPQDARATEKSKDISERVARSTLKSGHLTTRQHSHFIFGIDGASRNAIWQVFHAHPYYNSEQVSQRYVPIKSNRLWYTCSPELYSRSDVQSFFSDAITTYNNLTETLRPVVSELFFDVHRLKAKHPEKYKGEITKKCMEVSRYVMPLATNAYLYHTISALTLIRYARMINHFALPEAAAIILKMIDCVLEEDPDFLNELGSVYPEQANIKSDAAANRKRHQEFDARLKNKRSVLLTHSGNTNLILDNASLILGDDVAWNTLLIDTHHPFASDTLYPVSMDPLSRTLNHIHFTFQKKLSHTADSQEQRHRTLPGLRPHLAGEIVYEPDYVVPRLLEHSSHGMDLYNSFMEKNFALIKKMHQEGIAETSLTYLLPNAFPIRFVESGDLMNFYHKWKARLCFNAQEEIFYSTVDEVQAIEKTHPELYALLGPPCKVRTNTKPRCPEGNHFCGIKVWKQSLHEYNRTL